MNVTGRQISFFIACGSLTAFLGMASSCDSKKKDKNPARSANATASSTGTGKPQVSGGDGCSSTALQDPGTDNPGSDSGAQGSEGQGSTGQAQECSPGGGGGAGNGSTKPAPAPSSPSGQPSDPAGNTGAWGPGKGIAGCEGEGKVWIAVNKANPGKSGSCGESLANFCCTQSDILEKFAKSKSQLEPEFAKFTGDGLILYGCSTDGSSKTTFHFAKVDSVQGVSYRSLWIGTKSDAGTPPASCPRVSLKDLGYVESSGQTGTKTSTGTSTSVSTSTSTGGSTSTATGTSTAALTNDDI